MASASRSVWPLSLLIVAVLAADRATKYAVDKLTLPGSFHEVIPGLLNIVHTSNPGVAFGIFADSDTPWRTPLLIFFSLAVMSLIVWLLATGRAGGWSGRSGMALILGGAAGNLLDRASRRSVTDFIDFHVGSHHWYTFNLADSAICIGAALVVLELLLDWRHQRRERT